MRLRISLLLLFPSLVYGLGWNDLHPTDQDVLRDVYNSMDGGNWPSQKGWFGGSVKPDWIYWIRDPEWQPSDPDDPKYFVTGINLASARIGGHLPGSLSQLKYLSSLNVFNNELGGGFPIDLLNRENFRSIDLENNNFSGTLPQDIGNRAAFSTLYLLNVYNNNFSGNIPSSIGSMENLRKLYMGQNNFNGPIPESLGSLSRLQDLQLEFNNLSGSLPDALGNLWGLQIFKVNNNDLTGLLPDWLGNFQSIDRVFFNDNQFTGSVPGSWGGLVNVVYIYLQENELSDITALATIIDNPGYKLRQVDVRENRLDISEGSANLTAIQKLRNAGVTVAYIPQKNQEKPAEVGIGIRRMDPTLYPFSSFEAGLKDIDAPLVPPPDRNVLGQQFPITGGLVADGVTPLIIECASLNGGSGGPYTLEVKTLEGGAVGSVPKLYILQGGQWVSDASFSLSPSEDIQYAYLGAIRSDDVGLGFGSNEIECALRVLDDEDAVVGQRLFRIRKPPVTLVHGYNTDGDWGSAMRQKLAETRPYFILPDNDDENFVLTIRYGQDKPGWLNQTINSISSDAGNHQNTLLPLTALVPVLDAKIEEALEPLRQEWAFTRHDVVAHSQGGLLVRMLANNDPVRQVVWTGESASQTLPYGFRSHHNAFRGRFHRIITVGSPHNGSRLLAYIIKLDLNEENFRFFPQTIANLSIFSGKAQDKFDPFGSQIRTMNDPNGIWKPDPGAKFHLVRTTINSGKAPDFYDRSFIARALQLNLGAGKEVLPRGYDGIVDFDSMGALGEGQPVPDNVYTLPPENQVSHSGPAALFDQSPENPTVGQTASQAVADHVGGTLNQEYWLPPEDIQFGPFPATQLLGPEVEARIVNAARPGNSIDDFIFGIDILLTTLPKQLKAGYVNDPQPSYAYRLEPPGDYPIDGEILWMAEWWNAFGITSNGVELEVSGENGREVTMQVGTDTVGDLVLYANYTTPDGKVVFAEPAHVASIDPAAAPVAIRVFPDTVPLDVGARILPEYMIEYADGQVLRRFATAGDISLSTHPSGLLDVSDPLAWEALRSGTVEVTLHWKEMQTTMTYDIIDPESAPFTSWQEAFFEESELGQPDIVGPDRDPDGDGFSNLFEKLTGYNPAVADGLNRLSVSTEGQGRQIFLHLAPSVSDLTFTIERGMSPKGPWQFQYSNASDPDFEDSGILDLRPNGAGRILTIEDTAGGSTPVFYRVLSTDRDP